MRGFYYDRSTLSKSIIYDALTSPIGLTSAGSYTVAANKKALVRSIYIGLYQNAAPTADGLIQIYATYTISGGSSKVIGGIVTSTLSTVPVQPLGISTELYLGEGDKIECFYSNGQTGGSVLERIAAIIIEFDA